MNQITICSSLLLWLLCSLTWRIDATQPVGNVSQHVVQILEEFFVATNFRCNNTALTPFTVCRNFSDWITCNGNNTNIVVSMNFSFANLSGTLPSSLAQLTSLQYFFASNNRITGTIPAGLSVWGQSILDFRVSSNNLTGTLPPELANWSFLTWFEVDNNQLFGTLPSVYSNWTGLNSFSVSNNHLHGTLPTSYASWRSIVRFIFENNALDGTLPPQYSAWAKLFRVSASYNKLNGTIPPQFGSWTSMTYFDIGSNQLSGTLPQSLSAWTKTEQIRLSNNQLTGTIPPEWTVMSKLQVLDVSNNFLTGIIPWSFASLQVFSLRSNKFDSFVNASGSSKSIFLLDCQDNLNLQGPIFKSSSSPFVVTTCATHLCKPIITAAPVFVCSNSSLIQTMPDLDLQVIIKFAVSLMTTNVFNNTLLSCDDTPAPQSVAPTPTPNATTNTSSSSEIATSVVTVLAAATSVFAGGGDAGDAQVLVSILTSPCVCTEGAATSSSSKTSILLLVLSPFATLGASWAVIGNTGMCLILVIVQLIFVNIMSQRQHAHQRSSTTHKKGAAATDADMIGSWVSVDPRHRRETLAKLRFPNISVTLLLFLLPGVVRSVVITIFTFVNSSDEARAGASDSNTVDIISLVVGMAFLVTGISLSELVVYRHINLEFLMHTSTSKPQQPERGWTMTFMHYQKVSKTFAPVPRGIAVIALPVGSWEPMSARTSYGGLVSGFRGESRRAWSVLVASNLFVQVLCALDVSCDAVQSVTLVVMVSTSAFVAVRRPHRAVLASVFICCSFLLSICTLVLGMLCRHGTISSTSVSTFGVCSSVMLFVFKIYHIGLPLVERWLLQRNKIVLMRESMQSVSEVSGGVFSETEPGGPSALKFSIADATHGNHSRLRDSGTGDGDNGAAGSSSSLPLAHQIDALRELLVLATLGNSRSSGVSNS